MRKEFDLPLLKFAISELEKMGEAEMTGARMDSYYVNQDFIRGHFVKDEEQFEKTINWNTIIEHDKS